MKIVITCDSFKGCLSSERVALACKRGVRRVCPDAEIVMLTVADGGEGTAQAFVDGAGGTMMSCRVHGPMGEPVDARYALLTDGITAVIEIAQAAGLPLIPPEERNPERANSYGVGELIDDATAHGRKRLIIGLGGSATNDAGMGMLAALGARFYDADDTLLAPCGAALAGVRRIDLSDFNHRARSADVLLACDVSNPLYGPQGAAHIFAPQKGADEAMVARLDAGLRNFATLAGEEAAHLPGAGAAGGLGYAFAEFFNARMCSGIDLLLGEVQFDSMIEGAGLVITGEGRLDVQTLMGKAPQGILRACLRRGVPVLAIGGAVEDREKLLDGGFSEVMAVTPVTMPLAEAMKPDIAARNIASKVAEYMKTYVK